MPVGVVSSFQRTKYDIFHWKIDRFSKLSEKADKYYISPDFYFKEHRCFLTFYPNGRNDSSAGFFVLYLKLYNCEGLSKAHLTLGFKTESGRMVICFSRNIVFFSSNSYGTEALIRRSEFLERKEELASSDSLTFIVVLGPEAVEIIRDLPNVAEQTETGHEEEKKEKSEKKGNDKIADDMAKLLASGERSDATVSVQGSEFKVHSCILAARTPVFSALFEHDTLERATSKITITDCEPAIFKEFLNYIYAGSVQDLTAENSTDIYRVADKYLVEELKEVCRECIQDNLSSETLYEAVQLALKCGDNDLLESALDYFAANFRVIIRSVEWQRFIKENPIEANEIFIKSFGPP